MAEPVVILEIEFTPGVWTNVSSYLRAGDTKRGKAKATAKASVGRATFAMANQLRTFDPEYSGNISPGNLDVDLAIRAKVTYGATTYPLFTGQIDRIIQRYLGPKDSVAMLVCSDGLARLAGDRLGSPWEVEVPLLNPRSWFRLGEQQGPVANDRMGTAYGVYSGNPTYGEPGLLDHDPDSSVKFETTSDYIVFVPGVMPITNEWCVQFILNVPVGPTAGNVLLLLWSVHYPDGLTVWMDSAGRINVQHYKNGAVTYARTSTGFLFNSYNINIKTSAIGPPYIKILSGGIDWTDAASATGTGTSAIVQDYYVMGATNVVYTVDEFITYDYAPTDVQLFTQNFGTSGWLVDGVQPRVNRVLDAAGWSTTDRDIGGQWDDNLRGTDLQVSALEHLEAITATAEARSPFVERDGTLRIIDREEHNRYPYTVSQMTLGDGAGEIPYVEMGDYSLDMDTVENVVRRRWETAYGESEFIVEASNVVTGQRRRVGSTIDSEYVTPDDEYSLASFRTAKMSRIVPYIEGLRLSPRKNPDTMFPAILSRELGDRVTWKRRPQGIGAAISREVILEGIGHSWGPKRWDTTLLVDGTDAMKVFLFDSTLWGSDDWRFSV